MKLKEIIKEIKNGALYSQLTQSQQAEYEFAVTQAIKEALDEVMIEMPPEDDTLWIDSDGEVGYNQAIQDLQQNITNFLGEANTINEVTENTPIEADEYGFPKGRFIKDK